jgi:hypothetical protein
MAQAGFTPIQLYYSATTTNTPLAGSLAYGELAINITDGKLFYKDNSNVVQVLAVKMPSSVLPIANGGTGASSLAGASIPTYSSADTLSNKSIQARMVVIADGTSITINGDTTDIATQANTQAIGTLTINAPTGTPFNGQKLMLRLRSTNVQTFAWNAIFAGSIDTPLPLYSSGSNAYDYAGFIYNSTATQWQFIARNFGF